MDTGLTRVTNKTPATEEPGPAIWRVRVCLPGSIIHLTSLTEPIVTMREGRIGDVSMDLVTSTPESGDTIGFIDWPVVVALTWRTMKQESRTECGTRQRRETGCDK
jgi:hypothetical protein